MAALNLPWDAKEWRIDYEGRSDSQPVYHGFSVSETSTNQPRWTIYKFTYTGNDVTRRQVREKAIWDNRASIF